MSFDATFPLATFGYCSRTGFFRGDTEMECCGCGQYTTWFHSNVLLFFCSEKCCETFLKQCEQRDPPQNSRVAEVQAAGGS